jgi:hypothetical protein
MAIIFNQAKGRLARYADLPAAADAFVAVLLVSAGLESEATLQDYDNLSQLLAAANDEATFTGYSRQTLSGVTVTVNDTSNTVYVDCDDPQWSPTSAQALGKIVICYDEDTGAGTDANIIPLFADDFVVTTPTSGTVTYNVATGGFFSAS